MKSAVRGLMLPMSLPFFDCASLALQPTAAPITPAARWARVTSHGLKALNVAKGLLSDFCELYWLAVSATMPVGGGGDPRVQRAGFARLTGYANCEPIDYFLQKYEISLGRAGSKAPCDVSLGACHLQTQRALSCGCVRTSGLPKCCRQTSLCCKHARRSSS